MTKMRKLPGFIFWLGLFITFLFCTESFAEVDWRLKSPRAISEAEAGKGAPPSENREKQDEAIRPEIKYSGEGLKDPFLPLVREKKIETMPVVRQEETVKELPPLTVQGLIWGGAFPQAIINNKVVRAGDSIGEVRVKTIDDEGVVVLFANMEHKLLPPAASGPQPRSPSANIN